MMHFVPVTVFIVTYPLSLFVLSRVFKLRTDVRFYLSLIIGLIAAVISIVTLAVI